MKDVASSKPLVSQQQRSNPWLKLSSTRYVSGRRLAVDSSALERRAQILMQRILLSSLAFIQIVGCRLKYYDQQPGDLFQHSRCSNVVQKQSPWGV